MCGDKIAWYALCIAILKDVSIDEALAYMGERRSGRSLKYYCSEEFKAAGYKRKRKPYNEWGPTLSPTIAYMLNIVCGMSRLSIERLTGNSMYYTNGQIGKLRKEYKLKKKDEFNAIACRVTALAEMFYPGKGFGYGLRLEERLTADEAKQVRWACEEILEILEGKQ